MPDAVLVQMADAVTALLNTPATFSQSFAAQRNFPNWKILLEDLGTLRVDVVATGYPDSDTDTRDSLQWVCRCVIVIRKKFAEGDRDAAKGRRVGNAAVDALVKLEEEIVRFLAKPANRQLSNSSNIDATFKAAAITSAYNDEHLLDEQQFTGLIRADYWINEDL